MPDDLGEGTLEIRGTMLPAADDHVNFIANGLGFLLEFLSLLRIRGE